MSQQKNEPSFNPFANIHTARSFWERVGLINDVLLGCYDKQAKPDNPAKKIHYGFCPYFLTIISLGLLFLANYLLTYKSPLLQNLGMILHTLLFPFTTIFLIFASIIKIAALPVVGLYHLCFPIPPSKSEPNPQIEGKDSNPFSHLSLDRVLETSFADKIRDTLATLFGNPLKKQSGILSHLIPGLPFLFEAGLNSQKPWVVHLTKVIQILLAPLYAIFGLFLSILQIALLPVISIIHLLTQPVVPGQTPILGSFLTNPMTYVGLAIITITIGLIIQAANPLVFSHAVTSLAVMVPSFFVIGGFMTLGVLVYSLLHTAIPEKPSSDDNKSVKYTNPIADVFRERIEWINAYPIFSIPFLTVGVVVVLTAIVLSALYLTGNLLPDTLIGQIVDTVFQFMNSAFTGGIQGLGNLSGLEFFASISAETLTTISQLFSALVLTVGSFCLFDMMMRFASTLVRTPDTEIRYTTRLCTPDYAPQDHHVPMNFVQFGEQNDYYEIKNGNLYRRVLTELTKGDVDNKVYKIASASTLMTPENFRPTASVK